MEQKAFQDSYPDDVSHCYGCGRLNDHGLKIKSYWDGEESVCHFKPESYHTAFPGYVYGGLIASLIDCHGTGTAAAAAYKAENREVDDGGPLIRYLTFSLSVRYLRPTPIDGILELRGEVKENRKNRISVHVSVLARGKLCATGEVVCSRVSDKMITRILSDNN